MRATLLLSGWDYHITVNALNWLVFSMDPHVQCKNTIPRKVSIHNSYIYMASTRCGFSYDTEDVLTGIRSCHNSYIYMGFLQCWYSYVELEHYSVNNSCHNRWIALVSLQCGISYVMWEKYSLKKSYHNSYIHMASPWFVFSYDT